MYGPLWWLVWVPLRVGWWSTRKGVSGGLALVGNVRQQQPAGARMEVVDASGSTSVVGMAAGDGGDAAVPTVRVAHGGGEKEKGSAGSDSDSMMERVGKIIDGDGDGEVIAPSENENSDAPNPKKRMWEEPAQDASQPAEGDHAKRSRVKDEL
ncbi:Sec20 domain-containing protein [Magnaporthiopsis poae ATCC 64411]|uniref:Sec20 domain-containing protein n=1 Tax=Magnaporthiopsis poae (strain ATCC 64411 / 73-15) TaxID=644358 RepID=A0A0C4E2Y4_MAGP6|nr:Sec20 domain-containing protein [Magnaporthiopsis poae ATCC 64411]